jgi:hypothetical protein
LGLARGDELEEYFAGFTLRQEGVKESQSVMVSDDGPAVHP